MYKSKTIYYIVPTYGRIEFTTRLVNSLALSDGNHKIIIIDDELNYETYSRFNNQENIKCIKGTGDLWWGGAINLGIDYLLSLNLEDTDIVIFANNDMNISTKNMHKLIEELESNPTQILHPRTFNENEEEISSGAKVKCWFPYITKHPINFKEKKAIVDLGTARCLVMSVKTLKTVGKISKYLPQYQGDNDFTYRAKKKGIITYVLRDAQCHVYDKDTGLKNKRISSLRELWDSFFSIKSSNNLKYRYFFIRGHFNLIYSLSIVAAMTFNTIVFFFLYKLKK